MTEFKCVMDDGNDDLNLCIDYCVRHDGEKFVVCDHLEVVF